MLHMPEGLDIPSISDLYIESHTQAHFQIRKKGDSKVNNCLDSKIEREKTWTRKVSITTQCEQDWNVIHEQNLSVTQQKRAVKSLCKQRVSDYWRNHVKNLAVQGKTLELISLESGHSQWKSLAYNLPVRVTKFMLNALTDSLNTRANLLTWGKRSNDRCTKCGNRETLHHVLNHCSVALDQGRFTWRHNNVLRHIVEVARSGIHRNVEVVSDTVIYSDLAGDARPSRSTIPLECTQTNLIPDICIFWKRDKKLLVIELTVPFETNLHKANDFKSNKYASLISDIEAKDYTVVFMPIEIGSRGFISKENAHRLKKILSLCGKPVSLKTFRDKLASLAITSSFVIYSAKEEPVWECQNPLL